MPKKTGNARTVYIPDELWDALDDIGLELERSGITDVRDMVHRGNFISRSKVLCRLIELHKPAKPKKN